jgi:hypothetical protein
VERGRHMDEDLLCRQAVHAAFNGKLFFFWFLKLYFFVYSQFPYVISPYIWFHSVWWSWPIHIVLFPFPYDVYFLLLDNKFLRPGDTWNRWIWGATLPF